MISAAILSSIFEHFERCAPKEGCGVLALKRGKLKWIPCTNIAQEDEDFILDDEAQRLADEAKKSTVCVPIGEGENCW